MLQISVLGPTEVWRDGRPVPVPGGKTSELLVRLALDAGAYVSADRLVEELWAQDAVNTRRNTLQSKVARLRRALDDPGVIVNGEGGYSLAVERSAVDAHVVLREAAASAALLGAGDDRPAADLCAVALDRFKGALLQGGGDWAAPHRARLEEARMELTETRFAARLRLGAAADLVGELESAVEEHAYREALWELLLTALYRSGRQADALAAYQRVRGLLADELGLAPGPHLQALERQILAHDPALDHHVPGNLPSLAAELVGRDADVEAVIGLLETRRLVTIVGPGGIGKTALALAAGRRLSAPGGVWLARLESATTPDEVLDAVTADLHVTGGEPGLLQRLRTAPAVLILDNCEHVLDAAGDLALRCLGAAPALRILCTGQAALGVDGEALLELAPLAQADAVELFTRLSARAAREEAVRELCRSLDGLPLAIELAAARTRTLSVEEIARRLDDRFAVLSDPASRKPERRRALKATIRWSYDLLLPDDQRGLWALAAFPGGACLEAAEFVLAALGVPADAAMDVVARLANRSLVMVDDGAPAARYRLLDSIRAFALNAMSEAGQVERALAAHARWLAAMAGSSTAGVRSARQAEHLAFARQERANLDAALTWCATHEPLLGVRIVNGFGWAWIVLGDSRGAQRIARALDAAGDRVPPRDRAVALLLAGWIEASAGSLETARGHIAAATRLSEEIGDDELRARSAYHHAYVVSHAGDFPGALELTERAAALYGTAGPPWDLAANALFAARAAMSSGDPLRAAAARDDVERALGGVDDPWIHVRHRAVLGELARIEHRHEDAILHLRRAADTSGSLGYLQTQAFHLFSLGRAQSEAGDAPAGAGTLELAVERAQATGDVRLAARARVHLGRVLLGLGEVERARAVLEAATTWHRDAGGGEDAALGESLLAELGPRPAG